jgi:hypothetical protein
MLQQALARRIDRFSGLKKAAAITLTTTTTTNGRTRIQ